MGRRKRNKENDWSLLEKVDNRVTEISNSQNNNFHERNGRSFESDDQRQDGRKQRMICWSYMILFIPLSLLSFEVFEIILYRSALWHRNIFIPNMNSSLQHSSLKPQD